MTHLKFRAWTGKHMFYQGDQYLASFIRRAVQQIIEDSSGKQSTQEHESYLPNGGDIEEYLTQYTGKQDKNGRGVYDKDIIRFTNPRPGKRWHKRHGDKNYLDMLVAWNKKKGAWSLYWKNKNGELLHQPLYGTLDQNHQVVGNIYENAELLEAEK